MDKTFNSQNPVNHNQKKALDYAAQRNDALSGAAPGIGELKSHSLIPVFILNSEEVSHVFYLC